MLYETLSQPQIFLLICLGGFLCGFLYDFKAILSLKIKKSVALRNVFSFICAFLLLFLYFLLNLKINFGQFRIFVFCGFFLSFFIQRFLSNNFLAKPIIKWYNNLKERGYEKQKKV